MKPRITIGIPTYRREQVLVDTIQSILQGPWRKGDEIIVADQTPRHETDVEAQMKAWEEAGLLTWLRLAAPSGPGAKNEILALASSDIVLFLDDDVLVPEQLIDQHLSCYADPGVASVTGQVYTRVGDAVPSLRNPHDRTRPFFVAEGRRPAYTVIGCNHSVRRKDAISIGGFDAQFIAPQRYEEKDFAKRLLNTGGCIAYNPEAWLIHLEQKHGGATIGKYRWRDEWKQSACIFLYALRHGRNGRAFPGLVWMGLRHGPLRRDNVIRPWRWPWAWLGVMRSIHYGITRSGHIKSDLLHGRGSGKE